jgi:hypothetical protein
VRTPKWLTLGRMAANTYYEPGLVEQGSYEPSAAPPQPQPQPREKPTARTGLVVLTAALVQLVIMAACGNQWVTDHVERNQLNAGSLGHRFGWTAFLTYSWRFTPQHGLSTLWQAQLALVLVTLLLTALLVLAVVRGPVTFGRALFGTWTAVLAATVLGAIVRGVVAAGDHNLVQPIGGNRLSAGLAGSYGPTSPVVVAGICCGFVTALLTALIAVATRRTRPQALLDDRPAEAAYVPPPPPPPYYGEPAPSPAANPTPSWHGEYTERYAPPEPVEHTVQLPREAAPAEAEHTAQLPREPEPVREPKEPARHDDQPTTQFPRPPDDEHLDEPQL